MTDTINENVLTAHLANIAAGLTAGLRDAVAPEDSILVVEVGDLLVAAMRSHAGQALVQIINETVEANGWQYPEGFYRMVAERCQALAFGAAGE